VIHIHMCGYHVSNRPFPNQDVQLSLHPALQAGDFTGIGLLRHPPHPLGFVSPPLHPFPMYRAFLRSFEYYGRSVTMK
jgi:hypothetical protein